MLVKKNIKAMYFSPTDTTQKVVQAIARSLAALHGNAPVTKIDFTLLQDRQAPPVVTADDLLVLGVPVYAGRVPNVLLKYLNTVTGNGALAVAVVLYGNRHYDDAALELTDLLAATGFNPVATGAFIGEHSFSTILGQGRPHAGDLATADAFARQIHAKIAEGRLTRPLVPGNQPYLPYYVPKNQQGEPVSILKVKPKTNSNCIDCKICVQVCPMASINEEDVTLIQGICIKCGACIKKCPTEAKYFDDAGYLNHKLELEEEFTHPSQEPQLFL